MDMIIANVRELSFEDLATTVKSASPKSSSSASTRSAQRDMRPCQRIDGRVFGAIAYAKASQGLTRPLRIGTFSASSAAFWCALQRVSPAQGIGVEDAIAHLGSPPPKHHQPHVKLGPPRDLPQPLPSSSVPEEQRERERGLDQRRGHDLVSKYRIQTVAKRDGSRSYGRRDVP
ncbi:hypothetical protein PLICRDRAFT_177330 [Plicaturopsis crispa FD-325 SS-3]|nr:hypothetical protein PLICRDRAFT_177330 [Plicaturopsis crispa FD-325 SS-3]